MLMSYSFSVARLYVVSWNSGGANEEGVSLIQRKPLFDVKRRPLQCEGTPSLNEGMSLQAISR